MMRSLYEQARGTGKRYLAAIPESELYKLPIRRFPVIGTFTTQRGEIWLIVEGDGLLIYYPGYEIARFRTVERMLEFVAGVMQQREEINEFSCV